MDDAVVVRKALTDILSQDPTLEVAASAPNGKVALTKFPTVRPDIVLLDIEMPEMGGLETLRELRRLDRKVPIIMFSTLTERGAEATLDALALGATDYLTKPSNTDMATTSETISQQLIPKIKTFCHIHGCDFSSSAGAAAVPAKSAVTTIPGPVRLRPRIGAVPRVNILAIGVSTGGPEALGVLLPMIPANFPAPIVIAQHMPPIFTSLLAARLASKSAFPVRECKSGEPLSPGCAFLAPGDYHMVVFKERGVASLRLHQGPREHFCRPSVDVLFRSVAETFGGNSLGVILTGMGQDGLRGCEALAAAGAQIVVQDETSSVVWGMPGFVARACLAEKILPLDQLAAEIVRRTTGQAQLLRAN